jgi:hypothetical protein
MAAKLSVTAVLAAVQSVHVVTVVAVAVAQ